LAGPALLGIQLSSPFTMRPAARPPYLPSPLFTSQHFRFSDFQLLPHALPNGSREGNHSSVVKFTIFSQGSSPRFSASGRNTCFFEIRPLHSVKICTLTPFPDRALSSLGGIYKTAASTIPFFGPIREKNGSSTSVAA